jgi:tryptophan-rich sensory protein
MNNRYSIFVYTFITLIVGGLASTETSTDEWYQNLIKSELNPPGYVFGIVWPILYILMSVAAFKTFKVSRNIFVIQLFFNAIWSWLFFAFHMPLIALMNIWLLIYLNVRLNFKIYKEDKISGIIFAPYIAWLLFASYLNLFIVFNN